VKALIVYCGYLCMAYRLLGSRTDQ